MPRDLSHKLHLMLICKYPEESKLGVTPQMGLRHPDTRENKSRFIERQAIIFLRTPTA